MGLFGKSIARRFDAGEELDVNSYDSYDEALKEAKKLLSKGNQWWQIVDTMRGVIKFSDGHTSKFLVSF